MLVWPVGHAAPLYAVLDALSVRVKVEGIDLAHHVAGDVLSARNGIGDAPAPKVYGVHAVTMRREWLRA